MLIEYKNRRIEKECTIASVAEKRFGSIMAVKIQQRIDELSATDSVETMIQYRIGRCHQLVGDRNGQYALDLVNPYRLVFEIIGNEVQIAYIREIVNYH